MQVAVITCDPYAWALAPFAHLFNTYWSSLQEVIVGHYAPLPHPLPSNFTPVSLGKDTGQSGWSDGLIRLLRSLDDTTVTLMLEDYWLSRTADVAGIELLAGLVHSRGDILRIDLTTDRLYNGKMEDRGSHFGHYDLIETPHDSPYQMSFQAGIWNRSLLVSLLKPSKTPWEVEIQTQPPPEMRVLGTRQYPLRYINVLNGGDSTTVNHLNRLEPQHLDAIGGWLPR